MKAAAYGHADTINVLCIAGADPTKRNRFGRTALDYAKGVPGTMDLTTAEQLQQAEDKGIFNHDELMYILARRAEDSQASYARIVELLNACEKRFYKPPEGYP